MKYIKSIIFVSVVLMLAACSKHPSSLVGVWKSGEQGFFSAQIVLTLKGDGTGMLNASAGVFGGASGNATWEFSKDILKLSESDGSVSDFTVVSKSKTDLVLQSIKDGTILSFKRIGDS